MWIKSASFVIEIIVAIFCVMLTFIYGLNQSDIGIDVWIYLYKSSMNDYPKIIWIYDH